MSDAAFAFSERLRRTRDMEPLAPPGEYGRLTWLKRELETRAGLSVSVNTVHKWVHGTALPRPDNITCLSKVLKVDQVWLAMDRKPVANAETQAASASRATGAVMLLAGLIELGGGRVSFPETGQPGPHLWANIGTSRFGLVVVAPQFAPERVTFVVPEPMESYRVVGVVSGLRARGSHSVAVDLIDLTGLPKTSFGGFSVIELEKTKSSGLRIADGAVVKPMPPVEAWADLVW